MTAPRTYTAPAGTWTFPADLPARRRFFDSCVFAHPAKLHLGLLQRLIDLYTVPGETILDPMAGTGSLMLAATQMRNVICRDLENEYVAMMHKSARRVREQAGLFAGLIDIDQADARTLDCATFDSIITSPPYGFQSGAGVTNPERIAAKYEGELGDRWRRYLGKPPFNHVITSPPYGFETGNGISNERRAQIFAEGKCGRRWDRYIQAPNHASFAAGFRYAGKQNNTGNKSGRNYWRDMSAIYERLTMFLPPEGKLILVLKNHYRRGKLIDIVGHTVTVVEALGLKLAARHARFINNPSLWQRRRKEQGLPIVEVEDVLVFAKES